MTKKRLIVSYKNLSPEVLKALKAKYPDGFTDHLIKINKNETEFFYAVSVETDDAIYLVKVDVEVKNVQNDDDDDSFPDIEPAPVAGADVDFPEEEEDDDDYADDPVDDDDED
ncbi:MAG: hypothetical protein JXR58_09360 [Bacteroidales bacterium]|nr:hypothetical protein [Bacteroidales bacterium]